MKLRLQLLPAARLQAKCSTFTSRHMLPPLMLVVAVPTPRFSETFALLPHDVPITHDENATPAAEAQLIVVPNGPVRFSVRRSFEPMWAKKGKRFESSPDSKAANCSTSTAQRCKLPGRVAHCP